MSGIEGADPDEAAFDRIFGSVPRTPPPLGFRDGIMRSVRRGASPAIEWTIAAALALPSLAFLLWELVTEDLDLGSALDGVMTFTGGAQDQAFFFVDGLLIVAFALLGLGALVGSHALLRRP